ncbi:hypothetical protein TrVFT333_004598 [Trichoderma virens FT-333]|nr:hypothetical protein TrVFT333_004598 [Trichoderma virens FT-333]
MKTETIASVGLFAKLALSQAVINSGNGFGTYYYDIKDRTGCGNNFANMNQGFVECNQFTGLSLNQINNNNLVAMNHTLLASNLGKYCGKKVVVSINGVPSSIPFFIGDGCERCGTGSSTNTVWNPNGAPGLDFSLSSLDALNPNGCFAGHINLSWQILDQTLYNFDTNAPGQPTGPVNGGGSNPGNGGTPPLPLAAGQATAPVQPVVQTMIVLMTSPVSAANVVVAQAAAQLLLPPLAAGQATALVPLVALMMIALMTLSARVASVLQAKFSICLDAGCSDALVRTRKMQH